MDAVHIFWSSGCDAASPPFEEVGPAHVFEAAFDGEQGVGARFRPAASRPFESAADDLLAGAFHDAGTDRQSAHADHVSKVLQNVFTEDWSWYALWFRNQPSLEQERTTP